jgi:hypothetical protein
MHDERSGLTTMQTITLTRVRERDHREQSAVVLTGVAARSSPSFQTPLSTSMRFIHIPH